MDKKLLELDALSLTKYWLMSNAKLREEIDHDTTLHDVELCATVPAVAKNATTTYTTRAC